MSAKGYVATFNEQFQRLRLNPDPHAPMTPQQLLEVYVAKLRPKQGAYRSFNLYHNFRREMRGIPTLQWVMGFVADCNTTAPPRGKAKTTVMLAKYGRNMNRN
jgi:hypothetical protein